MFDPSNRRDRLRIGTIGEKPVQGCLCGCMEELSCFNL